MLLRGPSGIGKSEVALELVRRGHRLAADDVVVISRAGDRAIEGRAPSLIRHHLEIRGLGILSIPDLHGPQAVVDACAIDLVVQLEVWREGGEYDRVGLERPEEEILGLGRPRVVLPVRPAGNMATLVEAAARDHALRSSGLVAAERLDARFRDEASGS